ncbi:Mucin-associated surface protein (MASP) subgroup S061 [Trypanosoma cruzi]|uniref:Mucin-associated surface protein (MASP) subgroup S061 n=1 Tax=Trypanosoma cruzi TaxID=5693 RepID=A0A7J6XVA1_TRYCR|nr:Mucin-associated surface protein (MASP) subgroup S061 [Trypanosoma cruzi]
MAMMMMTGRVLLVCALCVLWCGAGGGGCSEPPPVPSAPQDVTSVKDNVPKNDNNSAGGAGGARQSGQSKALQETSLPEQGATGAGAEMEIKPEAKVPETAVAENKNEEQTQEVEDVGKKEDEEQEPKEEEEEEEEEEEQLEEVEEEDEQEKKGDDKKEEEEKKHEDAGTGTTKGMSPGSQEQPSLFSGAEGASNNTNLKSTQITGEDDPAADGAGTRKEKQNENKEANPKETPVEATAMKNTMATSGDSDSSTAVSHTTSPLLLLLLACAAAAVVPRPA